MPQDTHISQCTTMTSESSDLETIVTKLAADLDELRGEVARISSEMRNKDSANDTRATRCVELERDELDRRLENIEEANKSLQMRLKRRFDEADKHALDSIKCRRAEADTLGLVANQAVYNAEQDEIEINRQISEMTDW